MVGEPGDPVGESKNVHFLSYKVLELDSDFGSFHIPVFRNLQRVSPSKINLFVSTSDRKFRMVDDVDTQMEEIFAKHQRLIQPFLGVPWCLKMVAEAFSKCQVIS